MTNVVVAANRGDVGGGEVMLVNIATALRDLGHDVAVVAPTEPDGVRRLAEAHGLAVTTIPASSRQEYARGLRRWHGQQGGLLLWCNGLLPAVATALRPHRVVHLHQVPRGGQRVLSALARRRALAVVVPSASMQASCGRDTVVLPNWTQGDLVPREPRPVGPVVRIGFLGRVGRTKGVDVLGRACALLDPALRARVELVVAGDDRFMPTADREAVDAALASAGVRVVRSGWQSREEFFEGVDLAVFPSVWQEPFGLVAAEAMEARCPVVVSDAGALPEVVGTAYPWIAGSGDPQALADVLTRAVQELPAAELTASMRSRWQERYSPEAGRRGVASLLESLAARGLSGLGSGARR